MTGVVATFLVLRCRGSATARGGVLPVPPGGASARAFKKDHGVVEMMGEHKRIRQHKEDDDEDRHPHNPSAPGPSRPGYYGYSPYQEPDYQYPPYLLPATH